MILAKQETEQTNLCGISQSELRTGRRYGRKRGSDEFSAISHKVLQAFGQPKSWSRKGHTMTFIMLIPVLEQYRSRYQAAVLATSKYDLH